MRILYLISYAGRAGTEKYVKDLMRIFSAKGHDCRLAFWQAGGLSEEISTAGYSVFSLDMAPRHVWNAARRLARYCRENEIDIVHTQYPRENVIAVLSRLWRKKTRVLFTSHLTVRQGIAWKLSNRLLTPFNKAVITVCSPGAALLRENGVWAGKIHYIPNGIEASARLVRKNVIREEFALCDNCYIFLTMARYAPEKGLDVLLQALCKLKKTSSLPFVCLIAGEGALFEDVRAQIRDLGLEENVIQAGFRTDTKALMCSADAYVSSAVSGEAMSYAILEAMDCALPLAVTDVGAGRELAEGCGYVSAPGDAEGLAENMHRLLTAPTDGRALGAAGRRRVLGEFDLFKTTAELMKFYE